MTDIETLKYPVGRMPRVQTPLDRATREEHLRTLEALPARFRSLVSGLADPHLDTPYRPGGWTVRQVVHHVPESHMNAFVRFKLALTEDNPTIKPYEEDRWVRLPDVPKAPVAASLALLDALHERWVVLLESLKDADWKRPLVHPESGPMSLDYLLQLYAWHGAHHTAHITGLRNRSGW